MAQARTLDEAQIKRVQRYLRTRRNSTRDSTLCIIGISHTQCCKFITQLANKGVGVRVLAELAGHSSISVTQRYIDVNDA